MPPVEGAIARTNGETVTTSQSDRAAWHRATLDASGDGYTVLRAVRNGGGAIVDWVIVDANTLVRERWAPVVGEIEGTQVSRLDAVADNSGFAAHYVRALETGERQTIELELDLPRGKGGWRRVDVTPLGVDEVSVLTRDVSRERYLEEALQQRARESVARAPDRATDDLPAAGFARASAAALLIGAGVLSIANSRLTHIVGTNSHALLVTGCIGVLLGLLALAMPWTRHYAVTANLVAGAAIVLIVGSDHFNHYSRTRAAAAVYPVFFIVVIAWVGLTQRQGAATVAALVSALGLADVLVRGGSGDVAGQCVLVAIPVAAAMGEVLSWYSHRSRQLTNVELQRRLHDPLTGLANRTLLAMRLDDAIARARRNSGLLAVCYLDLDGFKEVNDRLGHTAGDELLVGIADRLRSSLREQDTIARMGGDEFVILCEDVRDLEAATAIAERVTAAISETFECSRGPARVTPSIGIAFSNGGNDTAEALLQHADTAMYRAKSNGRSRIEVFDQELQDQVVARHELEEALRDAVPNGELRVHYQPIVDAATGEIQAFEALMRWERPGFGVVPPDGFIPVAERTGLITELTAWVLRQACGHAVAWSKRWPEKRVGVSVNVSAHDVLSVDIVRLVRQSVARTNIDPALLTLELTESSVIDERDRAKTVLTQLRDLGINLAIDDFGTGYSSLTYLRHLPVNVVKIDRSFVRTIGTEREDSAIVAAVLGLGRNLGLLTVAEGVETPEQHAVLVQLGCEQLQGFLFARPMPFEEAAALIGRGVLEPEIWASRGHVPPATVD